MTPIQRLPSSLDAPQTPPRTTASSKLNLRPPPLPPFNLWCYPPPQPGYLPTPCVWLPVNTGPQPAQAWYTLFKSDTLGSEKLTSLIILLAWLGSYTIIGALVLSLQHAGTRANCGCFTPTIVWRGRSVTVGDTNRVSKGTEGH